MSIAKRKTAKLLSSVQRVMVFHLSLHLRDNISIFRTVTFLTLENPLITQRNSKLYYALEKLRNGQKFKYLL